MQRSPSTEKLHLGFLSIVDTTADGYVGGLLVTNQIGRPLEFQCTTPVRANRTQQILYGATLKPFLYADLIGKTLIDRVQVKPDVILVDQPELLELAALAKPMIACVVESNSQQPADLPDETRLQLGTRIVRFHPDHPQDLDRLQERSRSISHDCDVAEPLLRVREALEETLKAAA